MPNRRRLHVPGGTYYLFRRTDSRHPIFSNSQEYTRFDELLPIALAAADAKLLAYCWLPEALHLVLEIAERPVAEFMRDLMWRYSRSSWHRIAEDRPWFRERYHATLIQVDTYLPALIRYVHYQPIRAGLTPDVADYPYTSHRAYLGRRHRAPVCTKKLLDLLGCRGADRLPYLHAMAEVPEESLSRLFERGLPATPGVVGDKQFMVQRAEAMSLRRSPSSSTLIEKLIAHVAERHALSIGDICSGSRRREYVIARAQIVWLAIRWNVGTLTDVARHLHHSPSAMSRAVARYRYSRPELFTQERRSAAAMPCRISTWNKGDGDPGGLRNSTIQDRQ